MIDDPIVNWCSKSEPDEGSGGRRIDVPRGKMMGGSSSINGAHWCTCAVRRRITTIGPSSAIAAGATRTCCRSSSEWSAMKAAPTNSGAATGCCASTIRRRSPRVPLLEKIIEAAERIGLPFNPDQNGESQEGIGMSQVTIAGAASARAPRLLPRSGARAARTWSSCKARWRQAIILEGRCCIGVRYSVGGTSAEARTSREVIVSGGSINSPKLLGLFRHRPARPALRLGRHVAGA